MRQRLNAGLDFELKPLGLTIEREPRDPPTPSLPLPGPTPMNAGRGTKRRTPDLSDEDSPLSELSASPSAPEEEDNEEHRLSVKRAGRPRAVAGNERGPNDKGQWR